jgi:phosphoadenosine phosphosulfate reductase
VLSSSFGAQAAVSLHLLSRLAPDIPVILVDTGYLVPDTYRFVDQLTARLKLDVRVYRSGLSPAWQEARYGRLWQQGRAGIEQYNRMNKVRPMEDALRELCVGTWFAGLRCVQTESRRALPVVSMAGERYKVPPALARGAHLHRRRAHDTAPRRRTERGRAALLRAHARVRAARHRQGDGAGAIARPRLSALPVTASASRYRCSPRPSRAGRR